jgi:hypothetical protein
MTKEEVSENPNHRLGGKQKQPGKGRPGLPFSLMRKTAAPIRYREKTMMSR